MKSIYDTALANRPAPQAAWLYEVTFTFEQQNRKTEILDKNRIILQPISISLPTMEVTTRDLYFCGKKKAVPVYSNQSGDLSCEFLLSAEIFKVFALNLGPYATRLSPPRPERLTNKLYEIKIKMMDSITGEYTYTYTINNPIVTAVEHSDSLSYESDSQINVSMTIHYDSWNMRQVV